MEYAEFTPETKVLGGSFLSIIKAMEAFKSIAEKFMKDEGLDDVVYDREHWYPLQSWLNVLKRVKEKLLKNGFAEDQINYIFKPRKKDTASEIISLVSAQNFNMVVINHRPGKVTRFFTGSVYQKVVTALKQTTICIVT